TFLSDTNPLKADAKLAIKNHFRSIAPIFFSSDDAKSYLAVSSILHCFDGWSYLSNSISALLNGDIGISIHLAYYAELRAGMSFLASEGIGIFDKEHFCIDDQNKIIKSTDKRGTHESLWHTLHYWIQNISKPTDILKYFSYGGKNFEEWIHFIPGANSPNILTTVTKFWLTDWSFDIQNYKDDRNGRNMFSYRPTKMKNISVSNLQDRIEILNKYWKLLEPSGSNRFHLLDKYLFAMLFNQIHENAVPSSTPLTKTDRMNQTLISAGTGIDPSLITMINANNPPLLLSNSLNKVIDTLTGFIDPLSVIARALLMLRISSGATNFLLSNAGISKRELNFYWELVGVDYGFWKPGSMPPTFEDLWTDIDEAIVDVSDWSSNITAANNNLKSLFEKNIPSQNFYTQFNRAAFWGTGF